MEPTIICPKCKTEIKLTESLAAPLIESTRRDFEQRLAQKDTDIAKRESLLRERETTLSKAKETIDDQVAEKLQLERTRIAAEEAKKARLALATDLDQSPRTSRNSNRFSRRETRNWPKRSKPKPIFSENNANWTMQSAS